MTARAPCCANRRAVARPIPRWDAAPVTMQTFSDSSIGPPPERVGFSRAEMWNSVKVVAWVALPLQARFPPKSEALSCDPDVGQMNFSTAAHECTSPLDLTAPIWAADP